MAMLRTNTVRGITLALAAVGLVVVGGITAVLATVAAPGDDLDAPEPQRIGQDYLVAAGSTGAGGNWELHAYDSDMGLCVDLVLADGSSGGCGFELRNERVGRALYDLGIGQVETGNGGIYTFGAVVKGAGNFVRLEFADSSVQTVDVVAGPEALPFDFFITSSSGQPATNLSSVTVIKSDGSDGQTRTLQ